MFADLIVESLNVMHPRFAHADGRRSFVRELYHQFRRLWDKALPVKLGLGHVIVQADAELADPPELLFWRLGENGAADSRLGAVGVAFPEDVARELAKLEAARRAGYEHAVCVFVGPPTQVAAGVTAIHFDVERKTARVV